jgi:hypothetical protein
MLRFCPYPHKGTVRDTGTDTRTGTDTGADTDTGTDTDTDTAPLRQAVARARRAKPGAKRRQGRAKRLPRQGGLRVGVGGRCN